MDQFPEGQKQKALRGRILVRGAAVYFHGLSENQTVFRTKTDEIRQYLYFQSIVRYTK